MDNVICFPGVKVSLTTPTETEQSNSKDTFKKDGVINKVTSEAIRDEICKSIDDGIKDMVFYAVTKKGRVLVTITKDTDKLTGMLARIQHSLLLNDDISMDDYVPPDDDSNE